MYLDTSVLYDFYVRGSRSKQVQVFLNQHAGNLAISLWGETELFGALGRRVRDGILPPNLAERSAKRYQQHVQQGLYRVYALEQKHLRVASSLTRQFTLGVKAADALHLALIQAEGLELVTSDAGMARVAMDMGLTSTLIET